MSELTTDEIMPIPEFPNYFASKGGEIYSTKQSRGEMRLLKKAISSSGYYCVTLAKDKKQFTRRISSLVLSAFISQRPIGMVACHGIKGQLVDSLDNLSWQTQSQNMMDRYRDGTDIAGERNPNAKLSLAERIEIQKSKGIISAVELSKKYPVHPDYIRMLWRNARWKTQ